MKDVVSTVLERNLGCIIHAAVIHNQDFHLVKPIHSFREQCQGFGQGLRFIVTGDLYDQFHRLLWYV
jgi:hypothetical protein